jgi:hypothetical protein
VIADDAQQACCKKCGRTPVACAKTVAPECLDMQRRLVQSAQNAGAVQHEMSLQQILGALDIAGERINNTMTRLNLKRSQ